MSYEKAMEAAGAKVLAFEQFGSYQGDWWALVEYNGARGWVHGSYGSCSGCDAFESEFGYSEPREVGEEFWDGNNYRKATAEDVAGVQTRLADFGRGYLDLISQAEAETVASRNLDWDGDAAEMLAWLKTNANLGTANV